MIELSEVKDIATSIGAIAGPVLAWLFNSLRTSLKENTSKTAQVADDVHSLRVNVEKRVTRLETMAGVPPQPSGDD